MRLLSALRAAAFAVPVVAVLLACGVSSGGHADVHCKGVAQEVDCDVTQTTGTDPLNVCFDIRLHCNNGVTADGTGFCQESTPDSTVTKVIPLSEFDLTGCDSVGSMELLNQSATNE